MFTVFTFQVVCLINICPELLIAIVLPRGTQMGIV